MCGKFSATSAGQKQRHCPDLTGGCELYRKSRNRSMWAKLSRADRSRCRGLLLMEPRDKQFQRPPTKGAVTTDDGESRGEAAAAFMPRAPKGNTKRAATTVGQRRQLVARKESTPALFTTASTGGKGRLPTDKALAGQSIMCGRHVAPTKFRHKGEIGEGGPH